MISLVGYSGFVGSNLSLYHNFDGLYNSRNIEKAYGTRPEVLVYAGVRAEKFMANSHPDLDMEHIRQAITNMERIKPGNVILISTIDVLGQYNHVSEAFVIDKSRLEPYGRHRLMLEEWVADRFPDSLIVRLPALFGKNLKKNFLYDIMNIVPSKIKEDKMGELCEMDKELRLYYRLAKNGFYEVRDLDLAEKCRLKHLLSRLNFNALSFTDSRNVYQFYNLKHLWEHIQIAYRNKLHVVHMATEPLAAADVYAYVTGESFQNEFLEQPLKYDFISQYADFFHGEHGYVCNRLEMLAQIKLFLEGNQ